VFHRFSGVDVGTGQEPPTHGAAGALFPSFRPLRAILTKYFSKFPRSHIYHKFLLRAMKLDFPTPETDQHIISMFSALPYKGIVRMKTSTRLWYMYSIALGSDGNLPKQIDIVSANSQRLFVEWKFMELNRLLGSELTLKCLLPKQLMGQTFV
jgi:hypothetical protein